MSTRVSQSSRTGDVSPHLLRSHLQRMVSAARVLVAARRTRVVVRLEARSDAALAVVVAAVLVFVSSGFGHGFAGRSGTTLFAVRSG